MAVEDRWKHANSQSKLRWRHRWRDANGKQHSKSYATKKAAEQAELRRLTSPQELVEQVEVAELAEKWLKSKAGLRPKSVEACRTAANHVLAEFGLRTADAVSASDVRVWLGQMKGSASLKRQSLQALRQMLQLAVDDGLVAANATAGVKSPVPARRDPVFMAGPELLQLASAAGEDELLVLLLGTTGLRIGEAAGLQVGDLDFRRERLRVRRTISKGRVGPPKSHEARDVPLTRLVGDRLELAVADKAREDWVFTSARGYRLDPDNWRRNVFQPAAVQVGRGKFVRVPGQKQLDYQGMSPHELRHTAASLAIASGADVKVVQRMLGHASGALTVDLYGHLQEQGLADVAKRMDDLLRPAGAA